MTILKDFYRRERKSKLFRVWHEPWKTRRLDNIQIHENTLFDGLDEA